jgi:hypothetical protein
MAQTNWSAGATYLLWLAMTHGGRARATGNTARPPPTAHRLRAGVVLFHVQNIGYWAALSSALAGFGVAILARTPIPCSSRVSC